MQLSKRPYSHQTTSYQNHPASLHPTPCITNQINAYQPSSYLGVFLPTKFFILSFISIYMVNEPGWRWISPLSLPILLKRCFHIFLSSHHVVAILNCNFCSSYFHHLPVFINFSVSLLEFLSGTSFHMRPLSVQARTIQLRNILALNEKKYYFILSLILKFSNFIT